jgi:hypothetical protein
MSIGFSLKKAIPHVRLSRRLVSRLNLFEHHRAKRERQAQRCVIAQRQRLAAELRAAWQRREQRP